MNVIRTYDTELIKMVISDGRILETVAEDGFSIDGFEIDGKDIWLVIMDKTLIGLCLFVRIQAKCYQIHPMLIDRTKSKAAISKALKWLLDNTSVEKITASIPKIYRFIRVFALGFKFKDEGVNEKSFCKGGKMIDMWMMGITRKELGAL